MEKYFSQQLGELYDLQRLVEAQQKEGLHYVAFDYEASKINLTDLHFFQRFEDVLVLGPLLNLPNPMAVSNADDFLRSLGTHIEKLEEKLLRPIEQVIQEINSQSKMSPELQGKYYEKIFQQEVQQQMGHDLGNVYTHLIKEHQEGKVWVAYPDIERVSQADLRTFSTKEAAQQFSSEHSHVALMYDYNLIERVTAALQPLVQEKIDQSFKRDHGDKGHDEELGR